MSNKTQFSCVVFFRDRQPVKYRTVVDIAKLWNWCSANLNPNITVINIYLKSTRQFLKQVPSYQAAFNFTIQNQYKQFN